MLSCSCAIIFSMCALQFISCIISCQDLYQDIKPCVVISVFLYNIFNYLRLSFYIYCPLMLNFSQYDLGWVKSLHIQSTVMRWRMCFYSNIKKSRYPAQLSLLACASKLRRLIVTVYQGNFLLPEDGVMLRNVVNNIVVLFLGLWGRCHSKGISKC